MTCGCMRTLAPWFIKRLYEQGVSMGRVVSRKTVTTDVSLTGWGALCDGRPAYSTWTSAQEKCHINCLELKAVFLALQCFLPVIKDQRPGLDRQHDGGVLYQPSWRNSFTLATKAGGAFPLLTDRNLLSIRAVHVPSSQNCGADMLSRGSPVHREWRLHLQTIQLVWSL